MPTGETWLHQVPLELTVEFSPPETREPEWEMVVPLQENEGDAAGREERWSAGKAEPKRKGSF